MKSWKASLVLHETPSSIEITKDKKMRTHILASPFAEARRYRGARLNREVVRKCAGVSEENLLQKGNRGNRGQSTNLDTTVACILTRRSDQGELGFIKQRLFK